MADTPTHNPEAPPRSTGEPAESTGAVIQGTEAPVQATVPATTATTGAADTAESTDTDSVGGIAAQPDTDTTVNASTVFCLREY